MNRQQKRNRGRIQQKDVKYMISKNELATTTDKHMRSAMNEVTSNLIAAFLMSLSDEFGFGVHRLNRIITRTNNNMSCIRDGLVTIEDIKVWCNKKGLTYDSIFKNEKENL